MTCDTQAERFWFISSRCGRSTTLEMEQKVRRKTCGLVIAYQRKELPGRDQLQRFAIQPGVRRRVNNCVVDFAVGANVSMYQHVNNFVAILARQRLWRKHRHRTPRR